MKKLSIVLLALIVGLAMSTSLMAGTYSGGDGTTANTAYQIANLNDLQELQNTSGDWGSYFKQTANISFDANEQNVDWDGDGSATWDAGDQIGFSPIGNSSTLFTGNYNGQGYTIDALYINRSAENIGLFGYTNGSTIGNIGLTNVDITGTNYVGGLVGYNYNISAVSNSYSTGSVSGSESVGGLVGFNFTSSTVSNSYSTGSVSGSGIYVGGLVGYNYASSIVSNSYSTGSVSGTDLVGGLVGYNNSSNVSNSYSTGNVTRSGGANTYFGGFCGFTNSTIEKCYSIGDVFESDGIAWGTDEALSYDKGFVGYHNHGTYTNNFFDKTASNQNTDAVGAATPKTTAEMKTENFSGWDWTNTWERVGYNYPHLQSNPDQSLPVELSSFTAENHSGGVLLEWSTESEIENLGFLIEKQILDTGCWMEIANYLTDSALEGHSSTTEAHEYRFTDSAVQPGVTYEYRLGDVDYNGKVIWHKKLEIKVKAEGAKIPAEFGLQKAYPNPFNPATTISYQLASASFVKITIYDVRGKLVETLVSEQKDRGSYSVVWDAGGLSSGVYIYKITAGKYSSINKCLLIR